MGVGMILFWPALFFLASGEDNKGEIARLKGEYEALESAAIKNDCPYKDEIIKAREEKAAKEKAAEKSQTTTP